MPFGGGLSTVGRSVTIGMGIPPPPTQLQVTSVDDATVRLDWCGSPEAGGYHFYVRNINDGSDYTTDESFICH